MSERGRANTTRSLLREKQTGSKVRRRGSESVVFTFFFETHHIQFVLKKTRGKGRKGPEGCGSYAPRSAWRLGTYLDYNCSQLESVWGRRAGGLLTGTSDSTLAWPPPPPQSVFPGCQEEGDKLIEGKRAHNILPRCNECFQSAAVWCFQTG